MRFGTPQLSSGSNVSVISSFLFIATRGQFWPNVAGQNMRPTMPNMYPIATVANVYGVLRSLSMSPSWKTNRSPQTQIG